MIKPWVQHVESELSSKPEALRVINQQLWCCCWGDGIVVLDHSDLKQLRAIPAGDMGSVRDVAELCDGGFVIAASKGLFYITLNGKCRTKH